MEPSGIHASVSAEEQFTGPLLRPTMMGSLFNRNAMLVEKAVKAGLREEEAKGFEGIKLRMGNGWHPPADVEFLAKLLDKLIEKHTLLR